MRIGNAWILGMMLVAGGCDPFGGKDEDDGGDDDEGGEASSVGSVSATGFTTGGWEDDGGDASYSGTDGEDDGSASHTTIVESCSVSVGEDEGGSISATSGGETTTTTSGGEDDDGGGTTGALELCGVELEYGPYDNEFACGCANGCNYEVEGISPESADAFLAECDCFCDYLDCGPSITGGVTTNAGEDGEGTASGTSDGGEDTDPGATTSTTSGSYEDG